MPDDAIDVRVRRRLRELRTAQGLTLQQVAERAAIDVSTLSRLESGKRRLAIDHIAPLAAALGVSTDDLLTAAPPPDPRVRSRPTTHDGLTMWPLSNRGPTGGLTAYKIHIHPRRNRPPSPLPVHDGHDWMYVVDGRLRLLLGSEELTIERGETVDFATTVPHWFGAIDGPVEVIAILGPTGERTHLRR